MDSGGDPSRVLCHGLASVSTPHAVLGTGTGLWLATTADPLRLLRCPLVLCGPRSLFVVAPMQRLSTGKLSLVREDSSHVSLGGRCVHGRHLHIETLALLRIVARSSVALRQPSRSKVTMVSPAFSPSFLLPLPNDGFEVVFPSVGDMRHIPQHGARTYTEGVADRIWWWLWLLLQ